MSFHTPAFIWTLSFIIFQMGMLSAQDMPPDMSPDMSDDEFLSGIDPKAQNKTKPQIEDGQSYTIQEGDTLWDLAGKHLNNKWYWPKIWSFNPEILNPHFIYPGQKIRFQEGGEGLPTQIEGLQDTEAQDNLATSHGKKKKKKGQKSGPDMGEFVELDEFEDFDYFRRKEEAGFRISGQITIGLAPILSKRIYLAYGGFISRQEYLGSGEILASHAEKQMLSIYDSVYIKMNGDQQKPAIGDDFLIFRKVREVQHPHKFFGGVFGYSVERIGIVKIAKVGKDNIVGVITHAYRPIERGDKIRMAPEEFGKPVVYAENDRDLNGIIVDSLMDHPTILGEHNLIIVDKGKNHGVKLGNTFTVVHRGDRFTGNEDKLPNEEVGRIIVVEVNKETSLGLVITSIEELRIGDQVLMKKGA